MYFDNNTIYTYVSDRYSIENAYTYEDGIIHFGNNGTLYYDAENGTLQGANGKSFYKDESLTTLEEMKEAARNYNQGYSSSSSYSNSSSNRDPYERDMRRLTEHTSEYRSGSWRGDPARLMFCSKLLSAITTILSVRQVPWGMKEDTTALSKQEKCKSISSEIDKQIKHFIFIARLLRQYEISKLCQT